jgi:hypothetical protein
MRKALAGRPWLSSPAAVAVLLVLVEGLLALLGARLWPLAAAALVLAPGLALKQILPRQLGPVGRWAAVPIVGCAAASIVVISVSALGIPLTGVSVRLALLAVSLAGLAVTVLRPARQVPVGTGERSPLAVWLVLVAILCLAVGLQSRVIGGNPVPGNDWAHYLLYPDQIARQHSLAIDNPYWMLGGQPFRDDPGVGALYGGFTLMAGDHPSVLAHGIWLFALLGIVGVFLLASALGGSVAGLLAAAIYAAIPMNITILGWHGLANLYGLALLPLALLPLAWALRGTADRRASGLLALALVALAAAHRLSFLVACVALAVAALVGLLLSSRRRELLRFLGGAALTAIPLGVLVFLDLRHRAQGAGGVQDYTVYLVTKLNFDAAVSDLTKPVAIAGALALVVLLARVRIDRGLLVLYGLAAAAVALAYAWIVHLPTSYHRAVYFVPLVLAPAIALGLLSLARLPRIRGRVGALVVPLAVALGVLLCATTATVAYNQSAKVHGYYTWATPASLRGLAAVERATRPGEAVVTDRCWSFLAPWLLKRPVLAGLEPADILPAWETHPAAQARTILYGRASAARRAADSHGIRFALVNPGCENNRAGAFALPTIGTPVYESTRLVVLDLAPASKRELAAAPGARSQPRRARGAQPPARAADQALGSDRPPR